MPNICQLLVATAQTKQVTIVICVLFGDSSNDYAGWGAEGSDTTNMKAASPDSSNFYFKH